MNKVKEIFRAQPVLCISFVAAVITAFIIPPDEKYADYCNFSVICELFALMTAVAGLRSAGIFERLTEALMKKAGNERTLARIFIISCFFFSMLVTNDVALITFVPITLMSFMGRDEKKALILTVVLETVAANLGSMMTPIGNPQNLYIFDRYGLTPMQFVTTMLPTGILSFVIIMALSLLIPKKACTPDNKRPLPIPVKQTVIFSLLFVLCVVTVFKVLPFWVCAVAAVVTALAVNRKLLLKVDYSLLMTFLCFFVFVGNISRIDAVSSFFAGILTGNEILVGALLSQGISNVPAAVMLSGFTDNGTALLLGVNIGGLGTPIASMASLISLQLYRRTENADTEKYIGVFSAINFGMLAVLLIFVCFFKTT